MSALLMILLVQTGPLVAPPVLLTPAITRARPSAAARALSVAGLAQVPDAPVTVALQCLVERNGRLGDCIAADDGGTADAASFRQRLLARLERTPADPILAAALARTGFYRVALAGAKPGTLRSVIVRETVGAADRPVPAAARGVAGKADLVLEADPAVDIADFYPVAALRHGAMTRVTATCRVLEDRSLLCRDAHPDLPATAQPTAEPPGWRAPRFDPDFARATLRVFATMHVAAQLRSGGNSVGQEAPLTMNWTLP